MNLVIDTLTELWLTIIILHDVKTRINRLLVFQRKYQPTTQQATTHGAHRLVNHVEQRLAIFLHRMNELQTANRELIQTHKLIFLDAGNTGNMTDLCMLSLFKILQNGPCSYHA